MKIAVNIEFESLEEYLEFNGLVQNFFTKRKDHQKPTIKHTKATVNKKSKPTSQRVSEQIHTIPNFRPPENMVMKVKEFIATGQSFKTMDVASQSIMSNPNRRAKANKWLQMHPDLSFSRYKEAGKGGKGQLVYAPIRYENGKTILPVGQVPTKTDWPIKGATLKRSYRPITDSEMDDDLLTALDTDNINTPQPSFKKQIG